VALQGADIDVIQDEYTPFWYALEHNLDLANFLMTKNPDLACEFPENHPYFGKLVFERVAYKLTFEQLKSALDYAIKNTDLQEKLFLIAYNSLEDSIDKLEFAKAMSFKYAKQENGCYLLSLALERGASVNETDLKNGNSLLHIASFYGNDSTVSYLLEKGSCAYGLNDNGEYPEDLALNQKTKDLFEFFSRKKLEKLAINHGNHAKLIYHDYLRLEDRTKKLKAELQEMEQKQIELLNPVYQKNPHFRG